MRFTAWSDSVEEAEKKSSREDRTASLATECGPELLNSAGDTLPWELHGLCWGDFLRVLSFLSSWVSGYASLGTLSLSHLKAVWFLVPGCLSPRIPFHLSRTLTALHWKKKQPGFPFASLVSNDCDFLVRGRSCVYFDLLALGPSCGLNLSRSCACCYSFCELILHILFFE